MRNSARFRLSAVLAVAGGLAVSPAAAAPIGHTENGLVSGLSKEGMNAFLGIRYAAPPVGVLRWQPPQPVPQGLATKQATQFGAHCAQGASAYGVASEAEDCLFLNVYRPAHTQDGAHLPVMVWIHGGALVVGESDDYDPVHLVTTGGQIVVTLNYRLGYFGFLATSGLDAEGHVAGNYGLQDQQAALDWVRRNIAGFGGDAGQITVFGESAGGLSVLSQLSSPTGHGLFDRAIVESGAYALTLPTLAQGEASGEAVAGAAGCGGSDTACLRALSVDQILAQETSPTLSITPVVDGTTLPASIDTALSSGAFNRVPVMNGSNHDEYRQFLAALAGLTADQYPVVLGGLYGPTLGAAVAAKYPAANYKLPVLALAAVITDQTFACGAHLVDRWASQFVPVYGYEFNDRHAPEDFLPPSGFNFGASHASEIQFLFDIPKLPGTRKLRRKEQDLSDTMVKYWTNFSAIGTPSGGGTPAWAPFVRATNIVQSLKPLNVEPRDNFNGEHDCTFWKPVIDRY